MSRDLVSALLSAVAPVILLRDGKIIAASASASDRFGALPGRSLVELAAEGGRTKAEEALRSQRPGFSELQLAERGDEPAPVRFMVVPYGPEHLLIGCDVGAQYPQRLAHALL